MTPILSIIIPTRERATYLAHSIRTCTACVRDDIEILVLDNASTDETKSVVAASRDARLRYYRSDSRVSMRDNFERGINLSRGEIMCFIGDDDGVLPQAVDRLPDAFKHYDVDAIAAARAHYFWPDLISTRQGLALLPRHSSVALCSSREILRTLLRHNDYYRLPCVYHGFVRRSLVERVIEKQGRFFLSSQVDIFSSIALSMEGIRYAFLKSPIVVNGASRRSNGASHFGGGDEQEKSLWNSEEDVGFLPGFERSSTIGSLIIESALRYAINHNISISEIFDVHDVRKAIEFECASRLRAGVSQSGVAEMWRSVGLEPRANASSRSDLPVRFRRVLQLIRKFIDARPIDLERRGISNVYDGAEYLCRLLNEGRMGFLSAPADQVRAALRILRRQIRE